MRDYPDFDAFGITDFISQQDKPLGDLLYFLLQRLEINEIKIRLLQRDLRKFQEEYYNEDYSGNYDEDQNN